MGLRDLLRRTDINQAAELCREDETAVMLDVRTAEEYKAGHIEGSINVPLQNIGSIKQLIENLSAPIYTYCLSGARSRQAENDGNAPFISAGLVRILHVKKIGGTPW